MMSAANLHIVQKEGRRKEEMNNSKSRFIK